jgi:galactokinase
LNHTIAKKVTTAFHDKYGGEPTLIYSPGRINMLGEHIDYNDGFVMPAAIDRGIYFAMAPNGTNRFNFFSVDYNQAISVELADVTKQDTWKNYVLSVINQYKLAGKEIGGIDCVFAGDVPLGAGLSSSAALEGGVSYGLNHFFNTGYNRKELALLGQRAEWDYPGVKCGIMDQYANMNGKQEHVILLDCKTVEHQWFPLNLQGYRLVLINSKVEHELGSSEYNTRRQECEQGLEILKREKGVQSFRDAQPEEITEIKDKMPPNVYKRCKYVVEEIGRTQQAKKILAENDLVSFGQLMFLTHTGLSKLYEVSTPELDWLAEQAEDSDAVIGARLMGGGFGGCTLNIIKNEQCQQFLEDTLKAYSQQWGIEAEVYEVQTEDGTHIMSIEQATGNNE